MFFFFTLLVLSSFEQAPLPLVADVENETINTSKGSTHMASQCYMLL